MDFIDCYINQTKDFDSVGSIAVTKFTEYYFVRNISMSRITYVDCIK